MEAKLYGQNKGGTSINGIIKNYYAYAGENISAGDLVEYVNGIAGEKNYGTSVDTQISTEIKSGYAISAVQLDDNRIFIAHSYGSSRYLYGIVCTIDGATITYGTDTQLSESSSSGSYVSAVALKNGNVLVTHCRHDYYCLYGVVCTINGTTITTGTDTEISGANYSGTVVSPVLLPDGKVFLAFVYASSYTLYGIVVSIDGTTITIGTSTSLVASTNAGKVISACLLPNGNVFIAHSYGSSYYLYGIVVSISGTTIAKGTDTALVKATNAGYYISSVLLPTGEVFLAFCSGSDYLLYGMVCSVNGTTITKGVQTTINTANAESGYNVNTCLLPNSDILVTHGDLALDLLYGVICTVNGTTIISSTDTQLSSTNLSWNDSAPILLDNGTIFVAHSGESNHYLYAQIWGIDENTNLPTNQISATEYETQVRKTTTAQFDGVAKTSGTGGDDTGHNEMVSIWTLVATEEFTMADGNTLTDANGDIFLVREG